MLKIIYWLFLATIFFIVVAFSVLNSQEVNFYYFFGQLRFALAIPVVGAFVVGGLIGLLFGLIKKSTKRKKQ